MFPVLLSIGCASDAPVNEVKVNLTSGGGSVQISGLDDAVIQEIAQDSSGASWQALLPVYRMPVDTDLKNYQPVQPGTYHVKDKAVIFVPDTPFTAHQRYFVRYYKFDAGSKVTDFVTGRNRPGSLHYSDLEFK